MGNRTVSHRNGSRDIAGGSAAVAGDAPEPSKSSVDASLGGTEDELELPTDAVQRAMAPLPRADLSPEIQRDLERIEAYGAAAVANSTRTTYATYWRMFSDFAEERGYPVLPTSPIAVAAYASYLADEGGAMATIDVAISAIAFYHREASIVFDRKHKVIVDVREGIKRKIGVRSRRKKPLRPGDLRRILVGQSACVRAIFLLGFWGAFRRGELATVRLEEMTFDEAGRLLLLLPKSKTDQAGKGMTKIISPRPDDEADVCPVLAVKRWLAEREKLGVSQTTGWLFPGRVTGTHVKPKSVSAIIKRAASVVEISNVAGHSLRRGFAVSAAEADVDVATIQGHLGHSQRSTTEDIYLDEIAAKKDDATSGWSTKRSDK